MADERNRRVDETLGRELWRTVAQHTELAEALPRCWPVISSASELEGIVVRRLEASPARWTTIACVGDSGSTSGFGSVGAQGRALTPSEERAARAFTAAGPVPFSQLDPALSGSIGARSGANSDVWAVSVAGAEGHHGVALLVGPVRDIESSVVEELVAVLRTAFARHQAQLDLTLRREALEADKEALLSRLGRQEIAEAVVGADSGLAPVMTAVGQVAPTDTPVLILGETGTGKEVVARAIHERSGRSRGPIVRVNCGAVPGELIDSELFGHERGAFTGATTTRKGWFERADGGTLFLDEVGELSSAAQVRLLRVLQDGTLERVGGHQTIRVDVRIIAATNRDLEAMVRQGTFRNDLWYRLSVFPLRLPPLRERLGDLPALTRYFAERSGRRLGAILSPSPRDIELLAGYPWPGNVRELAAVVERAAILGGGARLDVAAALGTTSRVETTVAAHAPERPMDICTLDDATRQHIARALRACRGRIEGRFGAAQLLGVNPHTLRARMKKLGISWSQYRAEAD